MTSELFRSRGSCKGEEGERRKTAGEVKTRQADSEGLDLTPRLAGASQKWPLYPAGQQLPLAVLGALGVQGTRRSVEWVQLNPLLLQKGKLGHRGGRSKAQRQALQAAAGTGPGGLPLAAC